MYQNTWGLERVRLVVLPRLIDLSPWLVLVSVWGSYMLQAVSCKKKTVRPVDSLGVAAQRG